MQKYCELGVHGRSPGANGASGMLPRTTVAWPLNVVAGAAAAVFGEAPLKRPSTKSATIT